MAEDVWNAEVAASYDEHSPQMYADDVLGPTVEFLSGLANGGRALEFAIGTGRVALPLSARGVEVHGIDSSTAMLDVLRAKPGAERIHAVAGDMATDRVDGTFDLVYLVYNTITNLLTQAEQVACFRNAARHLKPGGSFVIEVFVPDLRRFPPGALAQAFGISDEYVGFDTFEPLTQHLVSHHFRVEDGTGTAFRSRHRWAWPAELDLMAELAGLTPAGRWAGWRREPFTADSESHVSVWTAQPA